MSPLLIFAEMGHPSPFFQKQGVWRCVGTQTRGGGVCQSQNEWLCIRVHNKCQKRSFYAHTASSTFFAKRICFLHLSHFRGGKMSQGLRRLGLQNLGLHNKNSSLLDIADSNHHSDVMVYFLHKLCHLGVQNFKGALRHLGVIWEVCEQVWVALFRCL